MTHLYLIVAFSTLLVSCTTYSVVDYGDRIVTRVTTPDGRVEKCVTDLDVYGGGVAVSPFGVTVFPAMRAPVRERCRSYRKQSFQTSSGQQLTAQERMATLLGLKLSSVVKIEAALSSRDSSEGRKILAELEARGASSEELNAIVRMAAQDRDIPLKEVLENSALQKVADYLDENQLELFASLRLLMALIELERDFEKGVDPTTPSPQNL